MVLRTHMVTVFVATAALTAGCGKSEAPQPAPAAPQAAASASAEPTANSTAKQDEPKLLQAGDAAPEIAATAHTGQPVKFADFKGKPIVVYFYPKDDTPGCTVEAQGFRDDYADIAKTGAVVLGVSTDDNESHRAFATKYELPFLLLPDTDQQITKAFGVPVSEKGYAKRVTFVIDRQGKIAKVFPEVKPDGHAKEVLDAISELRG